MVTRCHFPSPLARGSWHSSPLPSGCLPPTPAWPSSCSSRVEWVWDMRSPILTFTWRAKRTLPGRRAAVPRLVPSPLSLSSPQSSSSARRRRPDAILQVHLSAVSKQRFSFEKMPSWVPAVQGSEILIWRALLRFSGAGLSTFSFREKLKH